MITLAALMEADGCQAEAHLEDGVAVIRLRGSAEGEVTGLLNGFFERVHDAICSAEVKSVRVELVALEFMSSSCLKGFIRWLVQIEALGDSRYDVTFVSDPSRHWQKRSLRALQTLMPQIVTLA